MPPKRKNRATKTMATTAARSPANRHSAASTKRTGLGTEGATGKMSRLAPSVPFQMTTRRGAKGTSNHGSPAGPSSAGSSSRRSSLGDHAQQGEDAPSDLDDARPAKRSRTSTDSGSPQMSNDATLDHNTPMQGTPSPTPELQKPAAGVTLTSPKAAGKKRRASDDSTQSSKTPSTRPNGLLTRTQSDVSEQQPRRKKRKTTDAPADNAGQPPELTDASTAPNSPEQMPDVDGSQTLQNVLPTNGDAPAKSGRRLPGRRRQPHSDINIETDLRRQLNLKMSYRSLAKVQKALLDELSNRTTSNLEKDAEYHTQCPEYEPLMADLDRRRDSRLDEVNAMRTYRLEQLERIRIAEERIQKEQYINRFQELQDDFLLQCYFRARQIEREMKGEEADATDDEDNVLPPTYTDEPHLVVDDRIGSKYASRSRAYVEADKELERESIRRRFDLARTAFVLANDDADDSIADLPGGFASYAGPDRETAIAHYNIASLADAALDVERTPTPLPKAQDAPVLPNENATLLMMLADASSRYPWSNDAQPPSNGVSQTQSSPQSRLRAPTPEIKQELTRQTSPVFAPTEIPLIMPSQAAHSSPVKHSHAGPAVYPKPNEPNKNVDQGVTVKTATPARVSTHRIMDILNDDQEVPVSKLRESQPSAPEQETSSRTENEPARQQVTSPQSNTFRPDISANREEPPVDQALMDALGGPLHASNPSASPSAHHHTWPPPSVEPPREAEESLRRRDPLQRIRDMLDRKARENGRDPSDRSQHWRAPPFSGIAGSQSSHERSDVAAYDPQRPSTGLYDGPPSSGPAYAPTARRPSHDQGSSYWEHDRRMSGSQTSQQPTASPYPSTSAPHGYPGEHHRAVPTSPTHQSPYAPPSSMSLPPKPPGPPPAGPINFRFAHYDPAPSRPSYPPQSPNYTPASHSNHGPPPPQFAPIYGSPGYAVGYAPPVGSFPVPPPPSGLPYPAPLKLHQYGGQPILPANMAPPPPQVGQPMTFVGQSAPAVAFSPPQGQHPGAHYEQREVQGERPPEPQSRPRRQYRSYHAPGTQFRSYQGPGENRRRGG
ncbi:hypothetical protein T440DRAFT_201070 [Plenodomus tracheiphilus IPT5]|uniref:Uncharacterized protein n=1 Tax=Plenodomus tracheiphilus IPT5 TaxID=1408161 RepID=A0A6A7BHK2_9PLEO|nr:hypothetical protein T440DRAFT_201070 [Plenodomus tracheiphilus IPT5]